MAGPVTEALRKFIAADEGGNVEAVNEAGLAVVSALEDKFDWAVHDIVAAIDRRGN